MKEDTRFDHKIDFFKEILINGDGLRVLNPYP